MAEPLKGSCLCGAIRYTVDAPVTELRVCHCVHCQKASGTGMSVNAVVPASAFKLTGTPKRYQAKADSGRTLFRYFCGECGSPIYSHRETTPDILVVRAGGFDNAGEMRIGTHIWTKSRRSWSYIDPACTQVPGQPG
jgi:hypothetical protein